MRDFCERFRGGMAPFAAAILIVGSLLLSTAATAGAATTAVAPAKTASCSLATVGEKLGPTYVERLKVTNVSCSTGDSLIKAYNSCRLKHGGAKGKCPTKVDGYKCVEQREAASSIQFEAVVNCTKGRDVVNFVYSENT